MPLESPEDFISIKIKDFVDDRIAEVKEIIRARLEELNRHLDYRSEVTLNSVKEAKADLNLRLLGMNEFREAMKDQAGHYATRVELESLKEAVKTHINRGEHDALISRVSEVEKKFEKCATLEDIKRIDARLDSVKNWQIGLLVGLAMALLGVILDMSGVKI